MSLVQNIPFFSIILCLLSAAVASVLKRRGALALCLSVVGVVAATSFILLAHMLGGAPVYTFMMGHFPAPWGNELQCGDLEAILASAFSVVMFLSLLSSWHRLDDHMEKSKQNLYYVVVLLLMASLLSQVYSNDIFTCYVFLEIMTLAACSLITSRQKGRTLVAAMRYMIMNLVGSGLFLLGIILLYDLTGHLLMHDIRNQVLLLAEHDRYSQPLMVVIALFTAGLGIKSALFPFHAWVPDAYSESTPVSAALLSSLVSKGYIVILIKVFARVIGLDVLRESGVLPVLFVFSVAGIVMGSVEAIRSKTIGRMASYSSVAQISYIYLGISMGTEAGIAAALFQMISHSLAKSLVFLSSDRLVEVSGYSRSFASLKGSGHRDPFAGAAFSIGAMSMTGIPLTGGFVAKILLGRQALEMSGPWGFIALGALVVSTLLNIVYFLRTVVTIYVPQTSPSVPVAGKTNFKIAMVALSALNVAVGFAGLPVWNALLSGVWRF